MPVILTTLEECETWMSAPAEVALKLRRRLPDDALRIVATGDRQDGRAQVEATRQANEVIGS